MNMRSTFDARAQPRASLLLAALCAAWLCGCATSSAARGAPAVDGLSATQLLAVATALEQGGDMVRAEQYLQQALKQGAPASAVVPRLLRLYVADGQYRLAIDQAENYLRNHPRDRGVRLFLGTLYGAFGQELDALSQYQRVLAEAPQDAQAHFAMASVLHDTGREHARADRHFRSYLELEPHGPHAEEARSLLLTELVEARAHAREQDDRAPAVAPEQDSAAPESTPKPGGAAPGPVREQLLEELP
jgi:tetratricopeptide (TPR) repeat protein